MTFFEWAARWNIPKEAVLDFQMSVGIAAMPPLPMTGATGGSEARQQGLVRLDAAKHGVWLTRNNVGALKDERGIPVRYGLANESKEQNKAVKSGDLIGIRSITIQQHHVGTVIGQFVSREIKHEGWVFKGDKHEVAQLNWVNFVLAKGGDAAFCTGPGTFNKSMEV